MVALCLTAVSAAHQLVRSVPAGFSSHCCGWPVCAPLLCCHFFVVHRTAISSSSVEILKYLAHPSTMLRCVTSQDLAMFVYRYVIVCHWHSLLMASGPVAVVTGALQHLCMLISCWQDCLSSCSSGVLAVAFAATATTHVLFVCPCVCMSHAFSTLSDVPTSLHRVVSKTTASVAFLN